MLLYQLPVTNARCVLAVFALYLLLCGSCRCRIQVLCVLCHSVTMLFVCCLVRSVCFVQCLLVSMRIGGIRHHGQPQPLYSDEDSGRCTVADVVKRILVVRFQASTSNRACLPLPINECSSNQHWSPPLDWLASCSLCDSESPLNGSRVHFCNQLK